MNWILSRMAAFLFVVSGLHAQPAVRAQLLHQSSVVTTAVAVDAAGNIYAAGNGFVSKIAPDFQRIYTKDIRMPQVNGIALDSHGNVYLAGTSSSQQTEDSVPSTTFGCRVNCGENAMLVKVDGVTGTLLWVTSVAGSYSDAAVSVAVGPDSSIEIAGSTLSRDLPVNAGAHLTSPAALPAGFVARISADGQTLIASTYLNGVPSAMTLDEAGSVYLTGSTSTSGMATEGAYQSSASLVTLMASIDRGESWINLPVPARSIWIEPHPKQNGILYAATAAGLLRSSDGGASWTNVAEVFTGVAVTQIRIDPTNTDVLYAIAATEPSVPNVFPRQSLWKSTDSGGVWTKLRSLDSIDRHLWIHPSRAGVLYLTTRSSNGPTEISRDAGQTWTTPPLSSPNGSAMDAANGDVLWIGSGNGRAVYVTSDAGQNWRSLPGFARICSSGCLSPLFASNTTVLFSERMLESSIGGASYGNGVRISRDGGGTWTALPDVSGTAASADALDPKRIYVTGAAGPFFSPDLGTTWIHWRDRMDNPNITQVASAPDGTLYATAVAQANGFIARLDASLAHLDYWTYFSGAGGVAPRAIARDGEGRIVIAGTTASRDVSATIGQTRLAGFADGFVARFSADGARLDFATFLGGSRSDSINGLALASDGTIYVAGGTTSADYPVTADALQSRLAERSVVNGHVAAMNADGTMRYSTVLGGSYWDTLSPVVVNGTRVYIGAYIGSKDFPGLDKGPADMWQPGLVELDFSAGTHP